MNVSASLVTGYKLHIKGCTRNKISIWMDKQLQQRTLDKM